MLCYRGQSFCTAYSNGDCIKHDCPRALTKSEMARAERWWSDSRGPVPVAYCDLSNDCPDQIHPEVTT